MSEEQHQHLSDIISHFYANDSTQHEPTPVPTPYSHRITHENNGIDTIQHTESFTPHITAFHSGETTQVPVSRYYLDKHIVLLFHDYD